MILCYIEIIDIYAIKEDAIYHMIEGLRVEKRIADRRSIKNNPTVYLSTHTPEALKSLDEKIVMKL
jgi:hypothetical protein